MSHRFYYIFAKYCLGSPNLRSRGTLLVDFYVTAFDTNWLLRYCIIGFRLPGHNYRLPIVYIYSEVFWVKYDDINRCRRHHANDRIMSACAVAGVIGPGKQQLSEERSPTITEIG